MRLEINNGNISNYPILESFISKATLENASALKSLLSEIKLHIGDDSVNHLELATLAKLILDKCNELGIGIELSSLGTTNTPPAKRLSLSTKPYSIYNDRAGKASVTLIICGILATLIMYGILLFTWIINR